MPSLLGTETAPQQLKEPQQARMRAGTQKVRNTENGPRTFPSMLPVCSQKNRNDGGELSRQWNTQPACPIAGSPQAHPHVPTHTSSARGNRREHKKASRTQESAAHRSKPRCTAPFTVYAIANASAISRRRSACRYSRRPCLPSTSCGTPPTRSTRLQHARTPARHEPPPSRPYAPCTPHASAHESGE